MFCKLKLIPVVTYKYKKNNHHGYLHNGYGHYIHYSQDSSVDNQDNCMTFMMLSTILTFACQTKSKMGAMNSIHYLTIHNMQLMVDCRYQ